MNEQEKAAYIHGLKYAIEEIEGEAEWARFWFHFGSSPVLGMFRMCSLRTSVTILTE